MFVPNVNFGSKVRTFGCITMGSTVLFILGSRFLLDYRGLE